MKQEYLEILDSDTKRLLEENSKVLRRVVEKVPFLRDIENFCTGFSSYCEDTFQTYKTVKAALSIDSELSNLEAKLKVENLSDSEKQTLCNQVERLVEKLDEIYAEAIRMIKPEDYSQELVEFSKNKSYYQDLIKQYGQIKDCGSQTSLVSSTSAVDKNPNETVIDKRFGARRNAEESVEMHSATHGIQKEPSIAKRRSSRRRQIAEVELENLKYKKNAVQQLRERQLEIEKEREKLELRRR